MSLGCEEPFASTRSGAVTCDFDLVPGQGFDPSMAPPFIERDRVYCSATPGFVDNVVPFSPPPSGSDLLGQSGLRARFDSYAHAVDHREWLMNRFALSGLPPDPRASYLYPERPFFGGMACHAWEVIGAEEMALSKDQVVIRDERFSAPAGSQRELLESRWPAIRAEAEARGYVAAWLLYSEPERMVSVVTFGRRVGPPGAPDSWDVDSLVALRDAEPLGRQLDGLGYEPIFDRTQWTVSIWFPFVAGDHGRQSVWPGPLKPFKGDGVCEVSQDEHASNTSDCLATCGNARQDPGEDSFNCPGDVPLHR